MVLRARWEPFDGYYVLEVFVAGKWRSMHIKARKFRKLTKKDLKSVRNTVFINTGGEINVTGLKLGR